MPYVLDANNLIGHERGPGRPSEEDREALVKEVADRLRRTRARAAIYFDGPARRETSLGSLAVRSSGGSADEAILREVQRAAAPGEIVVVTADRALARRARDAGARTLGPDAFWKGFGASAGSAPREDPGRVDVEEWARYFADETNRD